MSTIPTLIPLYWAVIPIGFLLFLIVALALVIFRERGELLDQDYKIAELTDEKAALIKSRDHARETLTKITSATYAEKGGF